MQLLNKTSFEHNTAPDGGGSSIYLSFNSTLQYTLPAPAGRWLTIRQGDTYQLEYGAEELAFPYLCSPGVVGGTSFADQLGPGCSGPW